MTPSEELQDLKNELIEVCNLIKECTDSEERKILFEEKKQIQAEIAEIESETDDEDN
jgi:hypothetical protein